MESVHVLVGCLSHVRQASLLEGLGSEADRDEDYLKKNATRIIVQIRFYYQKP